MECDQCGRDVERLPYTCKGCGEEFCVDHRLPEEHGCVALTAGEAGQEFEREQGDGKPWFKDEFQLSNVESPDDSADRGRWDKESSDVKTEDCVECGKTLREHEIAGCPHCGEPYCGDHLGAHRRTCEERDEEGVQSTTTVSEHYQERTREKQADRKTRTDELEEERKKRYSSPDVNLDGSISEAEYEEDIQSIQSGKNEDTGTTSTRRLLWLTLIGSISAFVVFLAYTYFF